MSLLSDNPDRPQAQDQRMVLDSRQQSIAQQSREQSVAPPRRESGIRQQSVAAPSRQQSVAAPSRPQSEVHQTYHQPQPYQQPPTYQPQPYYQPWQPPQTYGVQTQIDPTPEYGWGTWRTMEQWQQCDPTAGYGTRPAVPLPSAPSSQPVATLPGPSTVARSTSTPASRFHTPSTGEEDIMQRSRETIRRSQEAIRQSQETTDLAFRTVGSEATPRESRETTPFYSASSQLLDAVDSPAFSPIGSSPTLRLRRNQRYPTMDYPTSPAPPSRLSQPPQDTNRISDDGSSSSSEGATLPMDFEMGEGSPRGVPVGDPMTIDHPPVRPTHWMPAFAGRAAAQARNVGGPRRVYHGGTPQELRRFNRAGSDPLDDMLYFYWHGTEENDTTLIPGRLPRHPVPLPPLLRRQGEPEGAPLLESVERHDESTRRRLFERARLPPQAAASNIQRPPRTIQVTPPAFPPRRPSREAMPPPSIPAPGFTASGKKIGRPPGSKDKKGPGSRPTQVSPRKGQRKDEWRQPSWTGNLLWSRMEDANKRRASHAGRMLETAAGYEAKGPKKCDQCRKHKRQCFFYKDEHNIEVTSCGECTKAGFPCSGGDNTRKKRAKAAGRGDDVEHSGKGFGHGRRGDDPDDDNDGSSGGGGGRGLGGNVAGSELFTGPRVQAF